MNRILLAYSGGLDTTIAIPWLRERYGAEIIAVTVDLGQGLELATIHERALAAGAVRAHIVDARDEFVKGYILPALQAGAVYEDRYLLATALGRPLLARRLVEIARMEGAASVAHGCTGVHNDQVRLESSIRALDPALEIIAAAQAFGMSPAEKIEYARVRHIAIPDAGTGGYSVDTNLWGRAIAAGGLEDAWIEPPEEIYTLTRSPQESPDQPAYVELDFEAGVPVRANGVDMPLLELIESLETIAGAHGVGRSERFERGPGNALVCRRIEAPAVVVLQRAHAALSRLVTPRELDRLVSTVAAEYADIIDRGGWYSPSRGALDAFVAHVQQAVTGSVRLTLSKGTCSVAAVQTAYVDAAPTL